MTTVVCCDVCGQPTDDPHEPCDRECVGSRDRPVCLFAYPFSAGLVAEYGCHCDNTTCPDCCWHPECQERRE